MNKIKTIALCLLALTIALTITSGFVLADSKDDFTAKKCTLSDVCVYGDTFISLDFAMQNNLKVKGFQIYRSTSKNGKYRLIANTPYNQYLDDDVEKGKVYYYKVRGYRLADGQRIYSKYSKPKGKRMTMGPVYISNLKVSSTGTVTGTLLKNKNADGYCIYYAATKKGPYKLVKTTGKSALQVKFKVPKGKKQYFFKARGYIAIGGKRYFGAYSDVYEIIANENKKVLISNSEIKEALGGKTITIGDLAFLEELSLSDVDCKDKDFEFLKYCYHLERLDFNRCSLESVKTICESLPPKTLKELCLSFTEVTDISPLKKLKGLRVLELFSTPVENVSVIEDLTGLKEVSYTINSASSYISRPYEVTRYKEMAEVCKKNGIKYDADSDESLWLAAEKIMDNFIADEITDKMTDYEKIKRAHDFICKKVTYGYGSSSEGCKLMSPYCPLIEGHGVCQDYAIAFGYLTARMGFETYEVSGTNSTGPGHGWNIIRLGNNYYHVDCTWDDPSNGNNVPRYTYFLKSDETLHSLRDYRWDTKSSPVCTKDFTL